MYLFGVCWVIFMENWFREYVWKLHRINLLQIGLIKYQFYYSKHQNIKIQTFRDFELLEPRINWFLCQIISINIRNIVVWENVVFYKSKNLKMFWKVYIPFCNVGNITFYQILWRLTPDNDGNLLNKISKLMDMRSRSIKKHEMVIW